MDIRSRPKVMQMKLRKIKDNTPIKKDSLSDIGNLTGKIADKTLEQLEREGVFVFPEFVVDAEDITKDQMILQSVNDTYRSGNVMGFLGCGDERLIIVSRFAEMKRIISFSTCLTVYWTFPTSWIWNLMLIRITGCSTSCCFSFLIT